MCSTFARKLVVIASQDQWWQRWAHAWEGWDTRKPRGIYEVRKPQASILDFCFDSTYYLLTLGVECTVRTGTYVGVREHARQTDFRRRRSSVHQKKLRLCSVYVDVYWQIETSFFHNLKRLHFWWNDIDFVSEIARKSNVFLGPHPLVKGVLPILNSMSKQVTSNDECILIQNIESKVLACCLFTFIIKSALCYSSC